MWNRVEQSGVEWSRVEQSKVEIGRKIKQREKMVVNIATYLPLRQALKPLRNVFHLYIFLLKHFFYFNICMHVILC